MSVSVISNDHFSTILNLFDSARHCIKIISPFIGKEMTDRLCNIKRQNLTLKIDVITRFYESDFCKGVSSILGLKDLNSPDIGLFALMKLHTKLYIFDDASALVGSANFTTGGFHFNNELSLLIQNDFMLVKELVTFFNNLYNLTNPKFMISSKQIDDVIQKVNDRIKNSKPFEEPYEPTEKWGAEPPAILYVPNPSQIVPKLSMSNKKAVPKNSATSHIWLKFEASSNSRYVASDKYYPTMWKGAMLTSFPQRKGIPTIKAGELFYMAVISIDENNKESQHIIGRGIFESIEKATDEMKSRYKWMNHYSIYCKIRNFEYVDTTIGNAIRLYAMVEDLGENFYASTQYSHADPKKVHYQKSHLKLTDVAMESIDSKLDLLFKTFGSIKI